MNHVAVILSARDEAFLGVELQRLCGHSSVATISTSSTTREQVFSRYVHIHLTLRSYAHPVTHCCYCSECPARATRALVSDLLEGGTVGPLSSGIKTGRSVF